MKKILICGHQNAGIASACDLLLAACKTYKVASSREISEIYDELFANESVIDPMKDHQFSQIQSSIISKIYNSSSSSELLILADFRTSWLLNEWKRIDEDCLFVFVYSSPEYALSKMYAAAKDAADEIAKDVKHWCMLYSSILKFYNRNQHRCILVNIGALQESQESFVECVNGVDSGFKLDGVLSISEDAESSIGESLVREMLEEFLEPKALYQELESCADLVRTNMAENRGAGNGAWQAYLELVNAKNRADAANGVLENSIENLHLEINDTKVRIEHLKRDLESGNKERDLFLAKMHVLEVEHIGLLKERDGLLASNADRKAELNSIEAKLNEKNALIDKISAENKAFNEQLINSGNIKLGLEQSIKKKDEQLSRYESEIKRLSSAYDACVLELNSSLEAINTRSNSAELELLQIQLHHAHEELEAHYRAENVIGVRQKPENAGSPTPVGKISMPLAAAEVVYDMRHDIVGNNWHYVEPDGRWAGHDIASELKIPSMNPGHYELSMDIVDAIEQEIFQEMSVSLNGTRLELDYEKNSPPAMVLAEFVIDGSFDEAFWTIQFAFPYVLSPADKGLDPDDLRKLSIRMRSLKLRKLD